MGNRAVITTRLGAVGVYLHWNGGRDSVEAFLEYCKLREFRPPEKECYGWARFCQIVGNFFGGDTSIGIDITDHLDCDNYDNGVYFIRNWNITGREYFTGPEQENYDLLEMLIEIDNCQPERDRLGESVIRERMNA